MRTAIYLASTAPLCDNARFARLLETVPAARREKVLRYKNAAAARLSLGAGLLLNAALTDAGLRADGLGETEYGKPWFPAHPDFHFNLSHSGEAVMCAVSGAAVGCDLEAPGRACDLKLADRFFHPEEKRWLRSLPTEEQADAFFRLWTCKESFVKALGLGLSQPLDSFSVQLAGPVRLCQSVDPRPWRLRSFHDGAYICALCGLEGVEDAPVRRVDFYIM